MLYIKIQHSGLIKTHRFEEAKKGDFGEDSFNMDSAELPGTLEDLTGVNDNRKTRSEISDSGNLVRGIGSKINQEESNFGNKKEGSGIVEIEE